MGNKQVKVYVLDETGHTEAMMAPAEAVQTVREQTQAGKWAFADGQLLENVEEGCLDNADEVVLTFPLVGGC